MPTPKRTPLVAANWADPMATTGQFSCPPLGSSYWPLTHQADPQFRPGSLGLWTGGQDLRLYMKVATARKYLRTEIAEHESLPCTVWQRETSPPDQWSPPADPPARVNREHGSLGAIDRASPAANILGIVGAQVKRSTFDTCASR